jgi:hypothetical protein
MAGQKQHKAHQGHHGTDVPSPWRILPRHQVARDQGTARWQVQTLKSFSIRLARSTK